MKRVLVTGGQGFLGRHVAAAALEDPAVESVIGTGRSPDLPHHYTHSVTWQGRAVSAPLPQRIRQAVQDARYAYVPCDLTQAPEVWRLLADARPDVVVHAAASLRGTGIADLMQSNLLATIGLVAEVATMPEPRPVTVIVSSGSVYGNASGRPISETTPCRPGNAYGHTKLAAEHAALAVAADGAADIRIARVFNLVGPGLQERHLPATVASQLAAAQAGASAAPLRLGTLTATRDFVDVRDAAVAILVLAVRGHTGLVVNVASGVETAVAYVVDHLVGRSEVAIAREHRGEHEQRTIQRAVADVSRLDSLGGLTERPLAESLDEMLAYYVDDVAQPGSSEADTAAAT